MKHFKPLLLLVAAPLILGGCNLFNKKNKEPETNDNQDNEEDKTPPKRDKVNVNIRAKINTENEAGYDVKIDFKDDDFDGSSTTFSDKIKMLSLGACASSENETKAKAFYEEMYYDNITYHLPETTADSIGYIIAHRSFENYDVVSLVIRSIEYKEEWSNNFQIGESGDHEGFSNRANEVYSALNDYLETYKDKEVKLWVSGYSRGGGIANVLASKIMTGGADENKTFVYTFEAPRGLALENAIEYKNVFNLVNNVDIVAMIPPEQYGLYRCGKDIVINSTEKNIDELLYDFDNKIELPEFVPTANYATEQEFSNFLITSLLEDTNNPETTLNTRAAYYANYQDNISYFMGLYFSLPQSTIDNIKNGFNNLDWLGKLTLFVGDGLYNFIKPYLNADNIPYDDAMLKSACSSLVKLLSAKSSLLSSLQNEDFLGNLRRIISQHALEAVYVLIK